MLKLVVYKTKKGLEYRTSNSSIIFFAVLFILCTYVTVSTCITESRIPPIALVAAIICFIGAIFREGWLFDKENRLLVSYWGLGPFKKKKCYTFDEINSIGIRHLTNRSAMRPSVYHTVLVISLKNNKELEMDEIKEKKDDTIWTIGKQLSEYTGLDMDMDRKSVHSEK